MKQAADCSWHENGVSWQEDAIFKYTASEVFSFKNVSILVSKRCFRQEKGRITIINIITYPFDEFKSKLDT